MQNLKAHLTAVILLVFAALFMQSAVAADLEPLVIDTGEGPVELMVEYAGTPEAYAKGLMFRDHLDARTGMIFDFHKPRQVAFWMRNTLISLDMIFIDADGVIQMIAPKTTPLSEKSIGPGEPMLGVLEINGGEAAELGVAVGDRVRHRMFD